MKYVKSINLVPMILFFWIGFEPQTLHILCVVPINCAKRLVPMILILETKLMEFSYTLKNKLMHFLILRTTYYIYIV